MPEFDQLTILPSTFKVEDWNKNVETFNKFIARVGTQIGDTTFTLGTSKLSNENNSLTIKDSVSIIDENTNANGTTLVLGPTNQSNLRMGYHKDYSWIQSHFKKPLAINPLGNHVGIGTATPKFQFHVSKKNSHTNLFIESKELKTGLHFHVNVRGAIITNRNNFLSNGSTKNEQLILSTPKIFKIQTGKKDDPYFGHTRLAILENGFTGIGTETPKNTLHIKGNKGMLLLEGKQAASIGFYPKGMNFLHGYMGFASDKNNNIYIANRVDKADIVIAGKRDLFLNTKKIKAAVGGKTTNMQPVFLFKKYSFKQTGNNKVAVKSTSIDHRHWTAAVVGFSTGMADIGEQGTGTSMEVKMVKLDGKNNWHIQANLRTHDNRWANWTVQVMFVQNQFCKVDEDYNAADPTPTIPPITGIPPLNF